MDYREVSSRVYKLTMTQGQVTYLNDALSKTPEWWERLSDITGIPPQWLMDNVYVDRVNFVTPSQFRKERVAIDTNVSRLIVVRPVSQDASGELTRLQEFV